MKYIGSTRFSSKFVAITYCYYYFIVAGFNLVSLFIWLIMPRDFWSCYTELTSSWFAPISMLAVTELLFLASKKKEGKKEINFYHRSFSEWTAWCMAKYILYNKMANYVILDGKWWINIGCDQSQSHSAFSGNISYIIKHNVWLMWNQILYFISDSTIDILSMGKPKLIIYWNQKKYFFKTFVQCNHFAWIVNYLTFEQLIKHPVVQSKCTINCIRFCTCSPHSRTIFHGREKSHFAYSLMDRNGSNNVLNDNNGQAIKNYL